MSRRRSKIRTMSQLHRCGHQVIEALEARTMLTTVITDTNPLTATPAKFTFEYKDVKGKFVRVVVFGDVSAEFVFAREDKDAGVPGGKTILGEHVPATSKENGRDMFHVFVAQASIDSYISVAEVLPPTTPGPRPMTPFTGNVSLTVFPTRGNNVTHTTNSGTGGIILGARSIDTPLIIPDEADQPRVSVNFGGLGLLPPTSTGRLVAGLSTGTGVSLGRFLFAGAVMGAVSIQGSMETFYCGQLLTGATQGQSDSNPDVPGNFFVGGDIRNILSKGSMGTDQVAHTLLGRVQPEYVTGVDFDIRGRVGQIKTGGDYIAFGKVSNTNAGPGLRTRQQDIETRAVQGLNRGQFTEFENGQFGDLESFFNNDTFATAQFLGSINSKLLGNDTIQLNGLIQSFTDVDDISDYYGVALMAGQRITVRLLAPNVTTGFQLVNGTLVPITTETKSVLHAGVFDPENRLIAADYSNVSALTQPGSDSNDPSQQQLFSFVAEKPGIYRFAVAHDAAFGTTNDRLGELPYQLQITGVGNLAIGGLVATGTINAASTGFTVGGNNAVRANIETVKGDLGAVYSVNDFITTFGGNGFNAIAQGGDLRAFDAMSLGTVEGSAGDTPAGAENVTLGFTAANLLAYTGSVGMIRARGTDRGNFITFFNEGNTIGLPAIGGDIQWISAPNTLFTDVACNGNIGVVQTKQFGWIFGAGSLSANADGIGKPGVIDLIDCTRGLGTANDGGPVISAGQGGNVRYIHVKEYPGTTNVYRPNVFGGGSPEDTTFVQGQKFTYSDDSGAQVSVTPTREDLLDEFGQPQLDPVTLEPLSNSGTLTILTYPIAQSAANPGTGGGGVVLLRATSTRGIQIDTDGATEIGDLVSTGTGPSLTADSLDPNGDDGSPLSGDENYELDPNDLHDNSITLKGHGRRGLVDVWNIRGNNFNFIRNTTGGELVNAQVGATGTINATNIGLARSNTRPGMLLEGLDVFDIASTTNVVEGNMYPYLQGKNAFTISSGEETSPAVLDIKATQSIGNLAVVGIVQRVLANSDGTGIKGVFEGISGSIYTLGQWRYIDIGEGTMPSGSGNLARSGIFAACTAPGANDFCGHIGRVVGTNADIRGDIVSNTAIGKIGLSNGSIINADIYVIQAPILQGNGNDLVATKEIGGGGVITTTPRGTTGIIEEVNVRDGGGIIGAKFVAFNIGPITVSDGYGVFNTELATTGNGRISQVHADGFGIRGLEVQGGQSVDSIIAIGDGTRLKTTAYSPSVRLSETLAIDPFFGLKPGPLTDIHIVLGTTKASPTRKGTSASGQIDFATIGVSRDVGLVQANAIRVSEFNVPNLFGAFQTADYTDKVKIVTGRTPLISIGKDALRTQVDVAGDVGTFSVGGAFRGSSGFRSNGKVSKFLTGTTLYGNIYALRGFDSIRVGTHYGSQGSRTPASIGEFITNGNLLSSSKFTVGKDVNKLVIGGDVEDGAVFDINGKLGTKIIIGEEDGDILVG